MNSENLAFGCVGFIILTFVFIAFWKLLLPILIALLVFGFLYKHGKNKNEYEKLKEESEQLEKERKELGETLIKTTPSNNVQNDIHIPTYVPPVDNNFDDDLDFDDDIDWDKEEKEAEELDREIAIHDHYKKKKENQIHHLRRALYDYVVLDIETNGLTAWEDDVIQVSAIKFKDDNEVDRFNTYVRPFIHDISDKITNLTGITNEDVENAPQIQDVLKQLEEFVGDLPIIGHNVNRFDIPFLIEKGFSPKKISTEDTLKMARNADLDIKNNKLPTLKKYFGVENKSHDALNDCVTTAVVYKNLRDA